MHWFRSPLLPLTYVLATLLAACAATPAAAPAGQTALDVSFLPKIDAGNDAKADSAVVAPDAGEESVNSALDASETGAKDVVAPPSAWACTSPGLPGCPCAQAGDCDGGHCVDTPNDGKVCSANCTDSCPSGWQCVAQGTGDVVFFCLPQWPVLCNPCDSDSDCASVGVGKALCVDRGPLGRFCGAGCSVDSDCPAAYSCQTVTSAQAKTGQQCMPAPGKEGAATECGCSKAATAAALGTSCSAQTTASDGKVTGVCGGVRQCGKDGLLACSAVVNAETCNGKDDDCDGEIDEVACDDSNACTTDLCDAAKVACSHTPTAGNCDADNNACTESDSCQDGKCTVGTPKKCDDANPCTLDACNPAKGCTATQDDGSGCDDGDLCSVGDVCQGGQCQPGKPKLCGFAAACQTIACDGKTGGCGVQNQAEGTACDDGTACSDKDACAGGACKGGVVDCNDANPCTLDTCDAAAGCKHAPNATPCDDSNACTDSDTCKAGACQGTAKAASACNDNNVCTADACDTQVGCTQVANLASCDDGNPCTKGDACKDKVCVSGVSVCQCQLDSDCKDDGNLCNGTMFCDKSTASFQCKVNPATVVTCDKSGDNACANNVCAAVTGKCASVAQGDGKSCDADGSVCTAADACKGGLCTAGAKLSCEDANPCTDDACDAKAACTHANNAKPCDADNNGCTANDVCTGGACLAGNLKNCNDANGCTADSCDKATGACKNDGATLSGQGCDADGSLCTNNDLCTAGVCKAGSPLDCDDKNTCTTDSCNVTKGCLHANLPDKTGCMAGSWCIANAQGVAQCVKAPNCGDKVIDPGEECDDGNQTASDGCTLCKFDKPQMPAAGEIIITEIMAAPSYTQEEWVEIYNTTAKVLSLEGVIFGDSNFYQTLSQTGGLLLQPGSYMLFSAVKAPGGTGGPVPDYVYGYSTSGIALNNGGEYVCFSSDAQCTTGLIAKVTFPKQTAGRTYQLAATKLDKAAMDNSVNWCLGKASFGSNGDLGTPDKANSTCP